MLLAQAMELEEEEKKAAELEAARIQAAAELLLKQEEERRIQGKSSCNKGDHGRNYQRRYT